MHSTKRPRFLFGLAAVLAVCVVVILNLMSPSTNINNESTYLSGGVRRDLVDEELLIADQEIQDFLENSHTEQSPSNEFYIYSRMGRAFANLKTRAAAEDKLFQYWEKDPENFVWIDLASSKYSFLSRKDDYNSLIAQITKVDSSVTSDFYYWHQNTYYKADASEHLLRVEKKQDELTPSQRIWLQHRLADNDKTGGNYETATSRLLKTMPEALELGGLPLVVYWWYDLSSNYLLLGQLNNALYSSSRSLYYAKEMNNIFQEVRARLKMGLIHESRCEFQAALDTMHSCYITASDSNLVRKKRTALAQLAVLARSQGDPRKELNLLNRTIGMAQLHADTSFTIQAYAAASNAYLRLGIVDSAYTYVQKATTINKVWTSKRNKEIFSAWSLYYLQTGNYAKADSVLALATQGQNIDQRSNRKIDNIIQLIKQSLEAGQADVAYKGIQRGKTLSLVGNGPNSGYSAALELALVSARFYAIQGEFKLAQQELALAENALSGSFNKENRQEFEQIRGEVASLTGDYASASRFFSNSKELSQEIKNPFLQNRAMIGLGESYLHQNLFDEAFDLFSEASKSQQYWPRLTATFYLGVVAAEQGNHQKAIQFFAATDSLLGATPPIHLQARLSLKKSISQLALGHPDKAYSLLMDIPNNLPRSDNNDVLRSFHLDINRDRTEAILGLLYDYPEVTGTVSPALTALVVAEEARWRPDKDFNLPDANNLNRLAQNNQGPILAFFVGKNRSFSWHGTPSGWTMHDLGATKDLQRIVTNVVTDMEYPRRSIDTILANNLNQQLLGQIREQWTENKPLTVVTDGFLTNVPFTALTENNGSVVHLTSLSIRTAGQRESENHYPKTLLAFGIDGQKNSHGSSDAELHFAESEAQSIAAQWPIEDTVLLLGNDARWEAFSNQNLNQFSAIHIATHAVVTQGLPGSSTLRFAEKETTIPVSISEVRDLNLDADLVFLSCCEAGRMDSDTGSGLNSFARAFLQAGSSSVLAPVVRVEDEASRYLAQRFYHHWLQGKSRAASLKAAQLDTRNAREEWRHPYYWAFFRLYMLPDYSSSPGR